MAMPGKSRRQNQIARCHGEAFAADFRIGARALQNEAQGRLSMTMRRRRFTGQEVLNAGVQGGGDAGLARIGRVFEQQHATLGELGRNFAGGALEIGIEIGSAQMVRHRRRRWFARQHATHHLPQRDEMAGAQPVLPSVQTGGRRAAHQARTAMLSVPISGTVSAIVSPGTTGATPSGVPVMMRSPGCRV